MDYLKTQFKPHSEGFEHESSEMTVFDSADRTVVVPSNGFSSKVIEESNVVLSACLLIMSQQ